MNTRNNFNNNLNQIIRFYEENKKHPGTDCYLGKWLSNQNYIYKQGLMSKQNTPAFEDFLKKYPIIKGYHKKPNGNYIVEKYHFGRVLRMTCFTEEKARDIYHEISDLSSGKTPEEIDGIFLQYAKEHKNCSFSKRT